MPLHLNQQRYTCIYICYKHFSSLPLSIFVSMLCTPSPDSSRTDFRQAAKRLSRQKSPRFVGRVPPLTNFINTIYMSNFFVRTLEVDLRLVTLYRKSRPLRRLLRCFPFPVCEHSRRRAMTRCAVSRQRIVVCRRENSGGLRRCSISFGFASIPDRRLSASSFASLLGSTLSLAMQSFQEPMQSHFPHRLRDPMQNFPRSLFQKYGAFALPYRNTGMLKVTKKDGDRFTLLYVHQSTAPVQRKIGACAPK